MALVRGEIRRGVQPMRKLKLIALLLLLATIAYGVSFAYAEARPMPHGQCAAGPGDIVVDAHQVLPTENETVWVGVYTGCIIDDEPYKGELENPNIYVEAAIEQWWNFIIVPPEDDFEFERGIYHYKGHYYLIMKWKANYYVDIISKEEWLRIHERTQFIYSGIPFAACWIGLGIYQVKTRTKTKEEQP